MQIKTNKPPCYPTANTHNQHPKSTPTFNKKVSSAFLFFFISLAYTSADYFPTSYSARPARARSQARFAHDASVHKNGWTRPLGRVLFFVFSNRLTSLLRRFVRLKKKGPPLSAETLHIRSAFFQKRLSPWAPSGLPNAHALCHPADAKIKAQLCSLFGRKPP